MCLSFHLCLDGVSLTRLISCETNIFHLGKCICRWEALFPNHYKPFTTMKLLDLPYPYKPLHYYEASWPTMLVYRTHDLILPNLFFYYFVNHLNIAVDIKKAFSFSSFMETGKILMHCNKFLISYCHIIKLWTIALYVL